MSLGNSLTREEMAVLAIYRNANRPDLARARRLSFQYVAGAGLFVAIAILEKQPWWATIALAVFAAYVIIRLQRAKFIACVMPRIIAKYEARIAELEAQIADAG